MAESKVGALWYDGFKLVTKGWVEGYGKKTTLPCHLSPENSADSMTIRWFKGSQCIYVYKNGQEKKGKGYEDRLTLNIRKLQKGNVSLKLRNHRYADDKGVYICQVQHGEHQEEVAVRLGRCRRGKEKAAKYLRNETEEQKINRKKSARLTDPSYKVEKLTEKLKVQLKERENQLEELTQTLVEIKQQLKQRENQLEKKDEELRVFKKELDDLITAKTNSGVKEPPITLTTEIKASFVEKNRTDLIKRITEVLGVIDDLLGKGILKKETYNEIRGEKTREDKVRMLHDIISLKGRKAMSAFYDALQKCDPGLVEDLDGGHR